MALWAAAHIFILILYIFSNYTSSTEISSHLISVLSFYTDLYLILISF